MAKAVFYVITDVGGRRHRTRTGFDTLVVFADNDECHRIVAKIATCIVDRCECSLSRISL